MPIQTQLSKRKKIGARGPLTAKRGQGGEPLLMTALNMTLVVTYVVLLVVSAWFFGQVRNVDSDENRAALGVDGTGTGALTLRNDLVHQCDTNLLNAPWYEAKTDNHLRLRCVPSHLVDTPNGKLALLEADWGTLEQLEYVPDKVDDALTGALTIRTEKDNAASLKKDARKPLASCAGDLKCQPGYQCILLPLKPVQCDVSKHSRCVCTDALGTIGVGDVGELTTQTSSSSVCWSSVKGAKNKNGNVMKGFTNYDVDQSCLGSGTAGTIRCIADDGTSGTFTWTATADGAKEDLVDILGVAPENPGGTCTRLTTGVVPPLPTIPTGGSAGDLYTRTTCIAECACSVELGASETKDEATCEAKLNTLGTDTADWVCGEWTSGKSSRRLSRHKKHHKHRTRSHKDDPLTETYDRLKPPAEHTVTNGQRLHELLYGATDSSRLTEGQYGPALAVLILSSLSVLSSVVVWVYDYFFAVYSDRASIRGTDSGETIFGKNQMWGRLGIALTVGTNIIDFLTDMGVFVLYQRAMYNNEIDEPYGTSLVWFEAGCYHGGANMSLKPKHEIDVNEVEKVQSPADLGGDGGLATVLLVVVCVRFFVYRVLGTSLFTGSIEI